MDATADEFGDVYDRRLARAIGTTEEALQRRVQTRDNLDMPKLLIDRLAARARPLADQIPKDDPRFKFTTTYKGEPRLWIDECTFVNIDHETNGYRLINETLAGQLILAEHRAPGPIIDQIANYVATCLLEQEQPEHPANLSAQVATSAQASHIKSATKNVWWKPVLKALGFMLIGAGIATYALLVLLSNIFGEGLAMFC